jgi:hypothetical protein
LGKQFINIRFLTDNADAIAITQINGCPKANDKANKPGCLPKRITTTCSSSANPRSVARNCIV